MLALGVTLLVALSPAAHGQSQTARPRGAGEWLLDRARDAVVGRRDQLREADIVTARTLLRAAYRIESTQLDALYGLHELESIVGTREAAAAALDQLVRADPTNEAAFGIWLADEAARAQTRERAQAWLRDLLTQSLPPANAALVRVRLAELAMQQLDMAAARELVTQAQTLCPDCPEPVQIALQLLPTTAATQERLAAILAVLRTDPTAIEPAWQGAFLLDDCEFHADAQLLYEHAFRAHARQHPQQPPPIECSLRAAENALARGNRESAATILAAAGDVDTSDLATTIWAGELFDRAGVRERAKQARGRLDPIATAVSAAPAGFQVAAVAQIAWFYIAVDSQPEKARPLAQNALERDPGNIVAGRALGWSLAAAGETDQARAVLAKVAPDDAFAALKLSELDRKAGNTDAARATLAALRDPPPLGLARELLLQFGWQAPTSQPKDRHPEIAALLQSFDRGVFEFDKDPSRFLEATVEVDNSSPELGQPWQATFSLTSRASFSIPLGADGLVNPVFLLSFRVDADRAREFPNLFSVNLNRWRFLAPGATIRVRRSLDVGPLRAVSQRFPQQSVRVTVFPLFDPAMTGGGQWIPSSTGRDLRPISLTRRPVIANVDGIEARLAALSSDSVAARFLSVDALASLLGEAERTSEEAEAPVRRATIPIPRVAGALRGLLAAESWEMRARTLDALSAAGLDAATLDAARACLSHPHWLVRLMSVRLLARQGRAFADDARRIADSDNEPLVRDMARAVLLRLESPPATTQPALPSQPVRATDRHPGE